MRAPDFEQGAVQVWRIADTAKSEPAHAAAIGTWAISGPFHPAWSWWMLSVVHLRDVEGAPPAVKHYPDAAYELMIVSINPDRPVDVDALESTGNWGDTSVAKFLSPADLVYQWHGTNDAQALGIGESAIRAIVAGAASPDSDWRSWWARWLTGTVEHYRAGLHGRPS